jgi:hypothetical protein
VKRANLPLLRRAETKMDLDESSDNNSEDMKYDKPIISMNRTFEMDDFRQADADDEQGEVFEEVKREVVAIQGANAETSKHLGYFMKDMKLPRKPQYFTMNYFQKNVSKHGTSKSKKLFSIRFCLT